MLTVALLYWAGSPASANARGAHVPAGAMGLAAATRTHVARAGVKVAVQPFEGPQSEPLRGLIVRIVRGRGFRTMTSLPRYEGTGQYPSLARDHHVAAFVTAGVEEKGHWQQVTFLVWNGLTGSVLGRWTASAPTPSLANAVGKGFWPHLGPAILKAQAPALIPSLNQAAPMRIDASSTDDEPVAEREKTRGR